MIKVIVAEDQQLILKDLCNKISKIDENINIVATARNGQSAYEKIIELKPDIVFTDINMPILNGIEMIEKVKKENIDTRFVIISGYKDFEYARAAIKAGVDEYLLKPIVVDDVKKILSNLRNKISMRQQDYEQHIIEELISNTTSQPPSINVNFDYKHYYVILFIAGPYSNFSLNIGTPFSRIWNKLDLISISKEYINHDEKLFVINGKSSNEKICIWASSHDNSKNMKSFCEKVIYLSNKDNIFVTTGVSRSIKHINNIGITNKMVRTILKKKLVFSKSNIFDCSKSDMYINNARIFLTNETEKSIKFLFQNNKKNEFFKKYNELLTYLEINNSTQIEIDKCFKSLVDIFNSEILEYNLPDISLSLDECICSSRDYNELSHNINIIFSEFIDEYNKNSSKNIIMDNIIEASKEYIKNHYSEDINVNSIASIFSVSPTYFSRLFKKEVGIPPVAYITRYRLEKACEYFDTTGFTVKQVSELCGYSDPFYFSKAFKSVIGVSPKDYKVKSKA